MTHPGPNITVVLVGDATLRQEVESSIDQRESLIVVGSVDGDQGITTAIGRVPDVVVITEPSGGASNTAEVARQIGAALPATRILVVHRGSDTPDPGSPIGSLIDGWVAGRIDLASPVAVADAVEWIFMGEGVLDPALASAVLDRHRQGASAFPLTATEEEVLNRLSAGDAVETLAHDYAVTPRLVRQHAGGALARLHPSA